MTPVLDALALTDLHANPANHRIDLGDRDSLTSSITLLGVIEPLIVTPDPEGGYLIIAGHRRHASAVDAGLDSVPCVVRESVDALTDATEMLHENIVRRGLSGAEQAKGVQQILDLGGNVKAIAGALSTSQKTVKAYATASKLAEATQNAFHAGTLTLDQALDLGTVEAHEDIYARAVERLAGGNNGSWAVREALDAVAFREAEAIVAAYVEEHGCKVTDKYGYEANCRHLRGEEEIAEHRGQACYGIRPDRQSESKIMHLCTNTARHGGGSASGAPTEDESEQRKVARRRVIANNKAWDTANEIRSAWIADFRTRKTAPKGALLPVARLMAARAPEQAHMSHAVVQINADHPRWGNIADINATLPTQATALRALVLAVVANREIAMDRQVWRSSSDVTAYYLETLASWGYTLTPPEALYVATVNEGGDPAEVDYPTTDAN